MSLVSQILHKIQFRYNQSHLEELDDDTLDDDVSISELDDDVSNSDDALGDASRNVGTEQVLG